MPAFFLTHGRISINIFWKKDSESESRPVVSDIVRPHGVYSPWNSLGQNTGVGSLSLLQNESEICSVVSDSLQPYVHGILQARILEWVAFPFSRGSSQPRDRTQVYCIAGGFFTTWATGKAQI